jgi:hypothetical protein
MAPSSLFQCLDLKYLCLFKIAPLLEKVSTIAPWSSHRHAHELKENSIADEIASRSKVADWVKEAENIQLLLTTFTFTGTISEVALHVSRAY